MAKPEQVLVIEPQNELKFKGPFDAPVTAYMKLTNPSERSVLFKIKTTAPKKYCVRPNSGMLLANDKIEIAICLQPFILYPDEKNKHKFMVQTTYAPDSDASVDRMWKDVRPEDMMDSKLKCVFEYPPDHNDGAAPQAHSSNNDATPLKASPKASSGAQQQAAGGGGGASGADLAFSQPSANSAFGSEMDKAAQEMQQLREEESSLRHENLRLKEEIIKLKHSVSAATAAQQQSSLSSKYTPPMGVASQGVPVANLLVYVSIVILGMILGKFIL